MPYLQIFNNNYLQTDNYWLQKRLIFQQKNHLNFLICS